ncbi:hypothetical protein K493DRAFT_408793 [Basidiobolus meristosporus CBS 931.73]|uniref:Uncharacterized protein n=1 Tax=Basidiobolus meristosporus CBS 931.73 TaxID=1314790 RepID=A0A1Y1Y3F5_9FUNG|nr:hypothetical protein K493DRAFT_408793 [Basidiobolus meristosporus CBS 931.73]|eukprot:ORX92562.1 hypothetical protein K493DRAFT_408793 [Basidiobolus meristosporus CBS 931.73]
MTDLKSSTLNLFENFKQNVNKWEEVQEEGLQLLSRWNRSGAAEETVYLLTQVLEKLRALLHDMHQGKHQLLALLSSQPISSAKLAVDHGVDRKFPSVVDIIDFMSIYIDMYEREVLLKETIVASASDSEPTQQRSDSLFALWKSQTYVDSKQTEYIEDRMRLFN